MKRITWNVDKAKVLSNDLNRGKVSFEECVIAIEEGRVLDDIPNPVQSYIHQRMLILEINAYAYVVPYVETDDEIFLKTVFPSRKHTAIYLSESNNE